MDSLAHPPQEIELKLALEPRAMAKVRRHPALVPLVSGRARTATVVSRYYDTTARRLLAAGVTLRLRSAGRHWLQTAKGAGSAAAGPHRRTEYEWPLPGAQFDLTLLEATPWKKVFAAAADDLKPLFTTDVRRTSLPLAWADGTRATLCLDAGTIHAGGRRMPISEIEIELVHGDAQRLYEVAQALAADVPVTAAHLSKAERGYALAGTGVLEPVRATRIPLAKDVSAAKAFVAVGADCLRQIGANAEVIATGNDGESVHQLRVGVRRLRSLLQFIAEFRPSTPLAPLEEDLQWLARVAGTARDWDVFAAETLAPITPQLDSQLRRDLGRIKARTTKIRRAHRAGVVAAVRSPRVARMLLGLGAMLAGLADESSTTSPGPPARALAATTLAKRDRRLRKRCKGLLHLAPADRHRARLAAKKLRYAAEFFAPLYRGDRAARYIEALARLQGSLGKLNDIATAQRLLGELVPAGTNPRAVAHATGIVRGWGLAVAASELARADKAGRAFAKLKPFWE
jgi:inorganic triphosphatase YgiF